jgi:hypothetical protein
MERCSRLWERSSIERVETASYELEHQPTPEDLRGHCPRPLDESRAANSGANLGKNERIGPRLGKS